VSEVDVLDGNAIAGDLFELFGRDATTLIGSCANCGRESMVGELLVYMRGPGSVVRCPHCGAAVMVLVRIAGEMRLSMEHFRLSVGPDAPVGPPL
jgi:DNA-directed RNA polymerase subunit RPC12/RpoP